MPVDRKQAEAYVAEQERIAKEEEEKFLATEEGQKILASIAPIKAKVLETLTNDPEQLYSFMELAELFWTIPPPPPEPLEGETREAYGARLGTLPQPEPKDAEHPFPTQKDAQLFNAALQMLVEQERVLLAYVYKGQDYFGIAKEEALEVKACACGGSCARHN